MGLWKVVAPSSDINLIEDPSHERAVTGWNGISSASKSRITTDATKGHYCLEITPTSNTTDGEYYAISVSTGVYYTFSIDVKGESGIPYLIAIMNTSNTNLATTTFTGDGQWHRYTVSYNNAAQATLRVAVRKNSSSSTAKFYIDRSTFHLGNYEVMYIDGDEAGCYWQGIDHASPSVRKKDRNGGRIYDLDSDLNCKVISFAGSGAPVMMHVIQEVGQGGRWQFKKRTKRPRTLSLICDLVGSSLEDLHAKREALWQVLKPDAGGVDGPVILMYTGADSVERAYLRAYYDGGMEYGGRNGFTETFTLRFIAYDTSWRDEREEHKDLTTTQNVTGAYGAIRRWGEWKAWASSGFNDRVIVITPSSNTRSPMYSPGTIYVGGKFTSAGGVTAYRIAVYDPEADSFSVLGAAGGLNDEVYAIAEAANGDLFIGGKFTDVQGGPGGTYNRITRYSAGYNAVGAGGADGIVYDIAVHPDGKVYAVGAFTNIGGVAANRAAYWDGSAWHALGTGLNATGGALAIGPDGYVYVGGLFTTAGGTTVNYMAYWDGTTWHAMGGGLYSAVAVTVDKMMFDDGGNLYVVGTFEEAGGVAVGNIAMWNGSAWKAVGGDAGAPTSSIYGLYCAKGKVYAGGVPTSMVDIATDGLFIWNGAQWVSPDIINLSHSGFAVYVDEHDNIYFGNGASTTARAGEITTCTVNGTEKVKPVLVFGRSGGTSARILWIENQLTGRRLYCDYSLLDGETVMIDLRDGKRDVVSTLFGRRRWEGIRLGSDINDFELLPGDNPLAVFVDVVGSPTMTQYALWEKLYWMADDVG
jgi:hypothetical protein